MGLFHTMMRRSTLLANGGNKQYPGLLLIKMDLFGNIDERRLAHVNIYADESTKHCPYSDNIWYYIGIIVEDLEFPLLDDIICQRYRGNFDEESDYYEKNNKIVHWNNIRTADTKNICKRWF